MSDSMKRLDRLRAMLTKQAERAVGLAEQQLDAATNAHARLARFATEKASHTVDAATLELCAEAIRAASHNVDLARSLRQARVTQAQERNQERRQIAKIIERRAQAARRRCAASEQRALDTWAQARWRSR